ncbi:MAG: LLM class flavin-dependent oxidoreductase, partial [Gaiellaceae bacterium]
MVCVHAVVADTEDEARRLFTTTQQAFTNMQRGRPGQAQPPIYDMDEYWTPEEKARSKHRLTYSFVGAPDAVREALDTFVDRTGIDELMIVANVFDHAARVRSYELLAA